MRNAKKFSFYENLVSVENSSTGSVSDGANISSLRKFMLNLIPKFRAKF